MSRVKRNGITFACLNPRVEKERERKKKKKNYTVLFPLTFIDHSSSYFSKSNNHTSTREM